MSKKIELSNRKAAFVELADWCTMSIQRREKGDFLEVTEWTNGEGYDIHIHDLSGEKTFGLTYGQFQAIKKCIKAIDNE
jgi:hypothetical protein